VTGHSIDWHIADDTQGRLFLDLSGSQAGGVAQTLTTVAGGLYRVDFDFAANPAYQSVESMRVTAAGTDQTFVFNAAGYSLANMGWQAKSIDFTATSSSTVLTFASTVPDNEVGPALDNVKVTLVGFSATEDAPLSSSVRATDPDGNALTYSLVSGAANGTLTLNASGTFVYTPNANFNGTDSFQVRANDGQANSPVQTFAINVAAVNDAPTLAAALADRTVAEDTAWSYTVPLGTFADVDNATLTWSARLGNGDPLPSWLAFDAATRTFSGTPPLNFNGTIELSVRASDGSSTASDTFNLTVTPVNDAPAVSGDLAGSVAEALPNGGFDDFQAGTAGWSRIGGGVVPNEGPSGSLTRVLGRFGVENGGSNGSEIVSKTFVLDPGQPKTAISFDLVKLDSWDAAIGDGSPPNEEVVVYVNGVAAFRFMPEGFGNPPGFDSAQGAFALPGGITGTYAITSSGTDTPLGFNPNWSDRVYKVTLLLDGAAASVKLGFGSTLDQPIDDESFAIDNVKVTHRLTDGGTLTFADPDAGDLHTASFAPQAGGYLGSFTLGSVDQAGNDLDWSFFVDDSDISSLKGGETIVQTYAVTVSDGKGGTDVENVAVTIVGRNDLPSIGGTSAGAVQEDGTLTASGLLTVVDADQGESSFLAGTFQGTYGSLAMASNGNWTYSLANGAANVQALNGGQTVSDSLLVKSADGTGHTISISIAGANDLPTATVGTVASAGIADGTHFHTFGQTEVGPWVGGIESVRGAVEFNVTAGTFSSAVFKFDTSQVGTFNGTFSVYAYRANGTISVSDYNAPTTFLLGTFSSQSLSAGGETSFDATAALADAFGAGTELGLLFTYSGDTGSSFYFNNFELVIG
jgi:choice-of-anchor C domain-containing protein